MIRKRKRVRSGIRDHEGPVRSTSHLQHVRSRMCAVELFGKPATKCYGKGHAHHVSTAATSAKGRKVGDDQTVALCAYHHAEGHQIGWETFARIHALRMSLIEIAETYWRSSPARPKYEAKIREREREHHA